MKVRDAMQRRVSTIAPADRLGLALQVMLWSEIRHLPVLNAEGRLVGMLSERDVLRARGDAELGLEAKVEDVMRGPVEHIHPNAEVADAAAEMSTKRLGCLPVVEAGTLRGVLTMTDVLGQIAVYPVPSLSGGEGLRAGDLMSRDAVVVSPEDRLLEAAAQMAESGVRHLCVVDAERRILGMLSDRDLRSQIGNPIEAAGIEEPTRRLDTLRVHHAMTEGARVATVETPLEDLVNIFLTEHVGAVPVVDAEDRLQGIVSYVDVLRAVAAGAHT